MSFIATAMMFNEIIRIIPVMEMLFWVEQR